MIHTFIHNSHKCPMRLRADCVVTAGARDCGVAGLRGCFPVPVPKMHQQVQCASTCQATQLLLSQAQQVGLSLLVLLQVALCLLVTY